MIDIGPAFIWTAVNLIILFLLMKKFLFKPVTAHMENRTRKIKEGLENAEKLGAEADEYKKRYEYQLKNIKKDAAGIVREANEKALTEYNAIISDARKEAEGIILQAHAEIERERIMMLREVKDQVASLALAAASKVIEANMDNERNRKLIDSFIEKVGAA